MLDYQQEIKNKTNFVIANLCSGSTSATSIDFIQTDAKELFPVFEKNDYIHPFEFQHKKQRVYEKPKSNSYTEKKNISDNILYIDSPFNILFYNEEEHRKKFIEKISFLSQPYKERLYNRIIDLKEAADEEYPYENLLSPRSLDGFLKFFKQKEQLKYPDVTLTPDGNIRVQWQEDKVHHLAIEFISDTEAKFVLFSPDPTHHMKIARISGKVTIESIYLSIGPYNVLSWITE